jgi:hypothetical protein
MDKFAQDAQILARTYGIHLPGVVGYIAAHLAMDYALAMDAQPSLVTVSNSGIPAFLTNYVDPKFVEVLTTPNKGAKIMGENKKGDWTTETAFFPVIESAGEVSSYGDYANNGEVTANANWPQRQSYHYQTITQWGERELDKMALGKIDWANRLNISSAKIMDKFQNKSYFFGIAGLQNYGLLNDPALTAPIAPSAGAAWSTKDALAIYTDIESLFAQLVTQSGGTIEMDAKLKLCMSPTIQVQLTKTTQYNVNVMDMLRKNFPGMTVDTAVEYATGSGQLVQLIAEDVDGQETGYCSFTEKMRAHAIERKTSSFLQKKSGGTWGCVILQPFAIAQMLGV